MNRYKLLIQYEGTRYSGWQKQPHTTETVQNHVEKALSKLLAEKISVVASGRTDAGTHSLGQVIHFSTDRPMERYDWPYSVNSLLPDDILVRRAWQAPDDFHAQHQAQSKTYKYVLSFGGARLFSRGFSHHVRTRPNLDRLNDYSAELLGEKDFKSFQSAGTDTKTSVRTIYEAQWKPAKSNRYVFTVRGSGFLKQMVRNIVGTQLQLESNYAERQEFTQILEARDRSAALICAPACGLFLFKVQYAQELDNKCRRLYNRSSIT